MNTNFVNDMKTTSRDLPNLHMVFNNIKTEESIEVMLFVEKKNDGPSKVVRELPIIFPYVLTFGLDYSNLCNSSISNRDSTD